jgi:epoxyqueuosine reductase
VLQTARECGFELAGIAPADPPQDFARYERWLGRGMAGEMRYLTDRRAEVRRDPRSLLAGVRSVICVGKLYNTGEADPHVSRYARGRDYHQVMREGLGRMMAILTAVEPFEHKICVDTAPLLERSFARQAGLGWIGRNTCLINEPLGSWFFLGEALTTLEFDSPAAPPPDRCGSCTRCIEACPTQALVPEGDGWTLDSRRCISYLTIELRGAIPEEQRAGLGQLIFGCDICQEVCPWNSRAPVLPEPSTVSGGRLEELAALSREEFRDRFAHTPVERARYLGLLRNVAVAMGNSGEERYREPLEALSAHPDGVVREHARWALDQLQEARSHTRV